MEELPNEQVEPEKPKSEAQPPRFPLALVFIDGMKELVEIMPREPLPCRNDPELFHPVRRSTLKKRNPLEDLAKEACSTCVIQEHCLTHAITYKESGIWGGTNEDERDALRARYKKASETQQQQPEQPDHLEQTG